MVDIVDMTMGEYKQRLCMQYLIYGTFILDPWYVKVLQIWSLGCSFAISRKFAVRWAYSSYAGRTHAGDKP